MNQKRQKELDALLARGGLSGRAFERILDGAFDAAVREQRVRSRFWRIGWLVPIAAAVAAVFLLLPKRAAHDERFASKGQIGSVVKPELELVCGEQAGANVRCRESDRLYFSAADVRGSWFLSAYAEPEGKGERVWFFPNSREPSVLLHADSGEHAVGRSAVILSGIPRGKYKVIMLLSVQPLAREQVLKAETSQVATLELLP
jgi:hypothetical protein